MKPLLFWLTLSTALPVLAEPATPSIQVTGVAEERVPPDQLKLTCSIQSEGEDLAAVAAANRKLASEITTLLRNQGLGEKEISTGTASFGERTEYRNGRHIKDGFIATTSLAISTSQLDLHDKLWFELAKFPEVSISAQFGLKERSQVRATARRKALQAAREKAEAMAAALGAGIGSPLSIVENPQSAGISFSNLSRNTLSESLGEGPANPLEPGLVSVTERVVVVFALTDPE